MDIPLSAVFQNTLVTGKTSNSDTVIPPSGQASDPTAAEAAANLDTPVQRNITNNTQEQTGNVYVVCIM